MKIVLVRVLFVYIRVMLIMSMMIWDLLRIFMLDLRAPVVVLSRSAIKLIKLCAKMLNLQLMITFLLSEQPQNEDADQFRA